MADTPRKKERMVLMPTLMPPSLIEAADVAVAELGYPSRAEYQRDALTEKIARTHPHLVDVPAQTEPEAA